METTISLFPCRNLDETLDFYRTLGFEITYEQHDPYLYGAVRQGGIELHFGTLSAYGAKNAFGACLVFVSGIEGYHKAFAAALREKYGNIPTAGIPRISRLPKGNTRFKVFDPTGNLLIYIDHREAETDTWESGENYSGLGLALENAVFLRDTYANDKAAAKLLETALEKHPDGEPLERARALAALAELRIALGEVEEAEAARKQLAEIELSEAEQEQHREELEAAERLERWIG